MACSKEDLNMLQDADLFGKNWVLAYNDDKSKYGDRLNICKCEVAAA